MGATAKIFGTGTGAANGVAKPENHACTCNGSCNDPIEVDPAPPKPCVVTHNINQSNPAYNASNGKSSHTACQ